MDSRISKTESLDYVIREIPVVVSKMMTEKLRLLQYPLRPAGANLDDYDILQTRIKASQNRIQLKWAIDTKSRNYDQETGENLAARTSGVDPDDKQGDHRNRLDTAMLESAPSFKGSKPPRYVIGVLKDGQLHMSSLNHVVQMKPYLPYFDKTASQDVTSDHGDTEDEGEEEATKITVKFTGSPRDPNSKSKQSKTYFSVRKQEEEEAWVDLTYVHSDPEEFNQLYAKNSETESPFYVINSQTYLPLLIPKFKPTPYPSSSSEKIKTNASNVSMAQLQQMTLPEQLKILMLKCKVMQYDQIVEYLKLNLKAVVDETTLLRTIQTVAILVQGCWVVRSDLVYETDFVSSSSGISASKMQSSRDLVLDQFCQNRIVERRKIASLTRLPNDEVAEILGQISQRVQRKGWEFILPYDAEFIAKYPEVVQRQALIWEVKNQQKNRKSPDIGNNKGINSDPLKPPTGSPPRRRSRNKSHSSDTDSGAESDQRRAGRRRRNSSRSDLVGIPSKVES